MLFYLRFGFEAIITVIIEDIDKPIQCPNAILCLIYSHSFMVFIIFSTFKFQSGIHIIVVMENEIMKYNTNSNVQCLLSSFITFFTAKGQGISY